MYTFPSEQHFDGLKEYSPSHLWLGAFKGVWQWFLILGEVHAEEHTSQIIFQKHVLVLIYKGLRH